MKKILMFSILTLFVLSVSACALSNDFAVFERTLDRGIETADQLDKIDAQDLSETNVTGLDMAFEDEISELAYVELAVPAIVTEIRALHQSIRVTHAEIVLIREDNRVQREDRKSVV